MYSVIDGVLHISRPGLVVLPVLGGLCMQEQQEGMTYLLLLWYQCKVIVPDMYQIECMLILPTHF